MCCNGSCVNVAFPFLSLVTERATKWAVSQEHAQCGGAGQRGSSRLEQDRAEGTRSCRATQNRVQSKAYESFIAGIFHLIFPDQCTAGNWNFQWGGATVLSPSYRWRHWDAARFSTLCGRGGSGIGTRVLWLQDGSGLENVPGKGEGRTFPH